MALSNSKFLKKTKTEIRLKNVVLDQPSRFALATDSHYSEKEALRNKHFTDALLKIQEFVKTVNQLKCDFNIHLGDFKDEDLIPNSDSTFGYLKQMEKEFAKFKGKRFHCVGNHDLDSITKDQFLSIANNTDIESGKGFYSFVINAVKYIILDANFDDKGNDHFFKDGGDWQSPVIPEAELSWLKMELSSSPYPCIIFCHHPLFAYVKNGFNYHVSNYLQIRRIMEKSGKVIAVFNGHMHEEMFHEINDIHYFAMNSMLEGTFVQRNCFYVVALSSSSITIDRYERINNYLYP